MKNTFGTSVTLTLFGESHGEEIGAVIDGLVPGITVNERNIADKLALRRPFGNICTSRIEKDEFRIVSGVFNGKTTGTPLTILIANTESDSRDYEANRQLARPGHADYTAYCKFHGYEDYRGGGHFSGRLTAPLVAAGAIFLDILNGKNILSGTHISRCAGIDDACFSDYIGEINSLSDKIFGTISDEAGVKMQNKISQVASEGDSVGGILETAVIGMPAGVGEPFFDSAESMISHALFSIPAVKGVEFGDGFALADRLGSTANDCFRLIDGNIETVSNHNGGINGGITNGMPLIFRCVIKPTPSIFKKQETVNFIKKENAEIALSGRHDPAIIHRARIVVDSIVALTLCDMLALRYGTDYLAESR